MCLPLLGAFSAKTVDPPHPPPPQKSVIQFQGIEGLDIKYHALGYATRMTLKRGVYDARACA